MPRRKTRYPKRAGPKPGLQLVGEGTGERWFNLVLNGDVQARARLILWGEQPSKSIGQFVADGEQAVTAQVEGDATAEQPDPGYQAKRRWTGA
ncbi:hypothetical protein TomMM35A_07710 [Sphingobium sp. TomMM35A]